MPVLAAAKKDSIVLQDTMPDGAEYHEAWHRISNLLMEPKRREKLYEKMRKKYGKLTDRELDEVLAEDFREFQLDVKDKIDYETKNIFKRIWNFIKTFAKLKDFTLAKLYYQINRGEFSNTKPSEENIQRFKNIYPEGFAPFTLRGEKFVQFPNQKALSDAVDSLVYLLFNMPIKVTDSQTRKESTTVLHIENYSDISALPFDRLWQLIDNSKHPAFQELSQNRELVKKLISDRLKHYQVKAINNEEVNDETAPMHIDDYTKANYEIDPFDNAPAEVKFFFSTVPMFVPSADGKGFTLKTSSLKTPVFVNPRLMWNTVINDLHLVRTQDEL